MQYEEIFQNRSSHSGSSYSSDSLLGMGGPASDLASLRKAQQETKIAGQNGKPSPFRNPGRTAHPADKTPEQCRKPQNLSPGKRRKTEPPRLPRVRPAQPAETGYAYSLLDEEEKSLYLQMLQSITGFSQETELTTLKPELLEPVFNSVLADHPEIFYVDGYTYTKHTLGEEIHKITFTARYTLTQAEAEQRKKE